MGKLLPLWHIAYYWRKRQDRVNSPSGHESNEEEGCNNTITQSILSHLFKNEKSFRTISSQPLTKEQDWENVGPTIMWENQDSGYELFRSNSGGPFNFLPNRSG